MARAGSSKFSGDDGVALTQARTWSMAVMVMMSLALHESFNRCSGSELEGLKSHDLDTI